MTKVASKVYNLCRITLGNAVGSETDICRTIIHDEEVDLVALRVCNRDLVYELAK